MPIPALIYWFVFQPWHDLHVTTSNDKVWLCNLLTEHN